MTPGVALGHAADQGPAMPATVVEDPLDAVVAVPEHQRPVANVAGPEVARFGDLRLVADVEPAAIEDRAHLVLEHTLVVSAARLTRNVAAGMSSTTHLVGVAVDGFGLCRIVIMSPPSEKIGSGRDSRAES